MNMSVQHGDGSKPLEIARSLLAVLRAPSPFRIDGPQWDVSEHDDRPARRLRLEIRFQPLDLVRTQFAEAFLHLYVGQADEVHILVVEALPAPPAGIFSISFEMLFAVIHRSIMLARNIEHL